MHVHRVKEFTCDMCGTPFIWDKTKHVAITFLVGSGHNPRDHWEHEFHICSMTCEQGLRSMKRADKKKLALKILNNGNNTK